jgi:hypothetical protein
MVIKRTKRYKLKRLACLNGPLYDPGSVAVSIDESAAADYRPEPRPTPGLATVPGPAPEPEPEFTPDPEPAQAAPPLPDDLVTRLLSAQVYLRESFADRVNSELIHPSRAALPPLWHVNAVQLARHAAQARKYRRSRDVGLATSLGYVLLAGMLVLAVAVGQWLALRQAIAIWLVLWIWAYIVSVRLVYAQTLAARRSAVAVIYEPEDIVPDPLPRPSIEQSLADLNETNVVLYRGASSPFVGSGVNVDSWHLTIDISKRVAPVHARSAATSSDYRGRPVLPDEVTGGDLQTYLLKTMPERVTPRPAAGNRLYVRGGSNAISVPVFRMGPTEPDRIEALNFRRPVTRVSEDVIQHYLQEPHEGARTYTYFTHSAWGGQVVLTLYVRAFVSNQTLFIEGLVYALRPLNHQFYAVRGLPTDRRAESSALFRAAVSEAFPELFKAPMRLFKGYRSGRADKATTAAIEEEIEGRRDIDFGALSSLRERVANYNLGDQFAALDEQMYYQIFNRRAIECIGTYLESKHVDLAEFNGQAGSVIGNTTANAKSIYSTAGNGVSATDAGD